MLYRLILLAAGLLLIPSANAALYMEDGITNAGNGSNLGSASPWGSSSSQVTVTAGNLSASGLLSVSPAGNLAAIAGTGGGSSYRSFNASAISSGTVYYSFLMKCTAVPSTSTVFLTGLLPNGTTSPGGSSDPLAVYAKANGANYQLGIRKNGLSVSNAPALLTVNATYLIVVKYAFGPGTGDDVISLFIAPTPGAAEPTPDAMLTGGTDAASLQNIYFKSSSSYGSWNFDTLRVGSTWADVIPSSTQPPPLTQPYITQVLSSPAGLIIRGTNGSPGASYQLLSSPNVALSRANWNVLATNQFDGNGNFACTNPVPPADAQMLYCLLVAGQVSPIPVRPSIITQPTNQTVTAGQTATFTVSASGTDPLTYQWYFNTNSLVPGAASSSLEIDNAQATDAGAYSVVITNSAGSVTSAVATLSIVPAAPAITTQPSSQNVAVGQNATFTVSATGTAPLYYQWYFNTNTPLPGANQSSLTVTNAQTTNAGAYRVLITNSTASVTSVVALLTVSTSAPSSVFNLVGFGQDTTGGGVIGETNAGYVKVYNAVDLSVALSDKKGVVKVIEIMNDLNLGYNEIPADAKTNSEPFRAHNSPLLHPVLLGTGVSLIDIQGKSGLTIFSANGATIRHATLNFKSSGNIIVRNLRFDEMWEWDESSKGNYDRNDWDFIDLGNSGTVSNIWIDHCTFTKAYDGITDIKSGSYNITFSWCKYTGDDGATNPNSWVRQQINALEANRSSYAMYNFLRNNGFSVEDIVTIIQGHDKTHLIGATTDAINAQHSVTFHHDWFINPWDRLPRLRGGNIHNFNIYVDDTLGLAARRLRDAREAAMSNTASNTLNNTYSFKPFLNGTISTEGGAILVEKSVYIDCITPLRNNQTDPNDPTYTGKIMALDTIYQMDSTVVRGNSTDSGNPLGPFQAPIIPFSWNLPGNQLPYSYTMDDPSQVQTIVTDPNSGAGAGVLAWPKTNWLKTSY
jgi:pectate lyase